jgi:hypothetical protein
MGDHDFYSDSDPVLAPQTTTDFRVAGPAPLPVGGAFVFATAAFSMLSPAATLAFTMATT